ncbi:hypothetical protein BC833DRAFT_609416 [Globomyces pollinis-pini]|nr:hypothetical protein BC833DRAFT_609416 [Globomyces pollinis-pini]
MSFYNIDMVDTFNLAGFTLNVEERSALRTSLIVKQDEEKLENIALWGKILGIQADYFIAQSYDSKLFDRKYYYTLDYVNWFQLPIVSPKDAEHCSIIQGKFIGDPSFEHTVPTESNSGVLAGTPDVKVKEEIRLAATISMINNDTEIVPRKAYYRDTNWIIKQNPEFKGLAPEEIGQLSNYLHFRDGFQPSTRTFSELMNQFDETIDIFEPITVDEPKGCWSIQTERGGACAILRNLVWPGYSLTHTMYPFQYFGFYYGSGVKNHNIGYML